MVLLIFIYWKRSSCTCGAQIPSHDLLKLSHDHPYPCFSHYYTYSRYILMFDWEKCAPSYGVLNIVKLVGVHLICPLLFSSWWCCTLWCRNKSFWCVPWEFGAKWRQSQGACMLMQQVWQVLLPLIIWHCLLQTVKGQQVCEHFMLITHGNTLKVSLTYKDRKGRMWSVLTLYPQ